MDQPGKAKSENRLQWKQAAVAFDERRLHHSAHEQCLIANSIKTEIVFPFAPPGSSRLRRTQSVFGGRSAGSLRRSLGQAILRTAAPYFLEPGMTSMPRNPNSGAAFRKWWSLE